MNNNCCGFDREKLVQIRIEKNISQEALARAIGTYQHIISKIETHKTKEPTSWIICKLSKYFKVPIEFFMIAEY